MRVVNIAICFIGTIVVFAATGCAGRASAAQAQVAETAPRRSVQATALSLDEVVQGLSDFAVRAKQYSVPEWDFVLGYAHFQKRRWKEAETFLAKVADALPLVEDTVFYERGVAAIELGHFPQALTFLDLLKDRFPESVWARDAEFERVRALVGMRRFREASEALRVLSREKHLSIERQARIDRVNAELAIESGQAETAVARVKALAVNAGSEEELRDLSSLIGDVRRRFGVDVRKWLDHPQQQYRLAQSFVDRSQWDEAAVRLKALLEREGLGSENEVRARWLLARCYRWTHRYDEAIALMQELLADPRARGYVGGVSATLATTYAKKDDYEKAIAMRKRMLARENPRSRRAANIAYKIAYLYMDEGKYAEAIPHFRHVAEMHGGSKTKTLARWHMGWCEYMRGQSDDAIAVFDGLLGGAAKRIRIADRVLYWKGRALEKAGRREQARAVYTEVRRKYPKGYYGEIARRRLAGKRLTTEQFARVSWMGGQDSQWAPDETAETESIHMARARFYDGLGLHEEAARELRVVDLKRYPELADEVMWLASRNFAHNLAYRLSVRRHRGTLKRGIPKGKGFDRFVWQAAYPEAYRPIVGALARECTVDPMLIWAIMRNESTFRPWVVSPAGAVGLMQLMPTTANRLASDVGEGMVDRRMLYRPAVNIGFGAQYLEKLSGLFPGNPVAHIASYNAGEEAVGRWLGNGEMNDIEEWIEEIPYSETNLYVKKVLASLWTMQRLYPPIPIASPPTAKN